MRFLPSRSNPMGTAYLALLMTLLPILGVHSAPVVADLSQPWSSNEELYNKNVGDCNLRNNAATYQVFSYLVIKDGLKVAEYGDTTRLDHVFSMTKQIHSVVFGKLVADLKLTTLDTTLGEIFTLPEDWQGVNQAEEKKAVTVYELLTFTSGLYEIRDLSPFNLTDAYQYSMRDVLNWVGFDASLVGTWEYIPRWHIFAWILYRLTGESPLEFVQSNELFSKIGIAEGDFFWRKPGPSNAPQPVEGSASGFLTNVGTLAKFAQLYLQNGLVSEGGEQLIPSDWVEAATTNQVNYGDAFDYGWGYQWIVDEDGSIAMGGYGGKLVYANPHKNLILVSLRETSLNNFNEDFLDIMRANTDNFIVPLGQCIITGGGGGGGGGGDDNTDSTSCNGWASWVYDAANNFSHNVLGLPWKQMSEGFY